ncbi:MAG: hypothetical protein US40_C0001G0040 [Candidatus Roizmanbacteria bacterium GW2011_GWC2_37_13]|uniref:Glycosyltransferase RgtA/B/C/D-like domain-containing protein n=1 Tax=Candidatus Roizmanbacteria bacterium GW2011_GWC2_37_13 TaxID=1618486 RepID=A0A0G0JEU8_9BACT|nr:MAG: hypothetical protein US38_C0002G0040 [Candidatus Roizmanbacteria bacterium GW2011_GWC1_37_12]KKQ26691.1 MAG: hypothetical protein US40_C0001G0040 [Candidatus Roizmanbacteria bacterium GW2011_GWC2_37_13]
MDEIIILSLKIIFFLFFTGFGITRIILPEKLQKYGFWLSPWLGTVFIVLLSVSLNLAGIPISQGKYVILSLSLFFLVYSLFLKRKTEYLTKEIVFIAIFTGLSFLINIFPLLYKIRFPTSISFGNLDVLTYSNVGDYLINHTVRDVRGFLDFRPYIWSVIDFVTHSFRWGSPMILSFFSSLIGLKSYQVFTILINLYFSLSFPLVYILTRTIYQKDRYFILVLTFLTFTLNSTILYMLYHVFFGQFIFVGLYLFITILVYSYFEEIKKVDFYPNNYDFIIALVIAAVATIYPEGLLFILFPIAGFVFFKMIFDKHRFSYLSAFTKFFIISIVISPVTFGLSIRQNIKMFISTIGVTTIGWEKIRSANPLEMIGLYNINYSQELSLILALAAGLTIASVWIIGFTQIKNKLIFLMNIIMILFLLVLYRYVSPNFFTYHRTVTYTIFFFIILFTIGVSYLFSLFKNKIAKLLFLIIILVFTSRSFYRTYNLFYAHLQFVDQSLVSLSELNKSKKIKKPFFTADVYLGEYNLWKRAWRENILMDKDLISRQNYVRQIDLTKEIKLVLAEKSYLEREEKKIVFKKVVWENDFYKLGEIEPLEVWPDLIIPGITQ